MWETISDEAVRESALWGEALLPGDRRELLPIFSPLGEERFALGLETIYEGYLLHYGRSRLFGPRDRDTALLLGDYLYAHGLVRIAEHEDVTAVADLAELISLCAQLRAESRAGEGAVWAATAALLGAASVELEEARETLRSAGDPEPLETLARELAGEVRLDVALVAHRARVG